MPFDSRQPVHLIIGKCFNVAASYELEAAYRAAKNEGRILSMFPLTESGKRGMQILRKSISSSATVWFQASASYPAIGEKSDGKVNYFEMACVRPALMLNEDGTRVRLVFPVFDDQSIGSKHVYRNNEFATIDMTVEEAAEAYARRMAENLRHIRALSVRPTSAQEVSRDKLLYDEHRALADSMALFTRLTGHKIDDPRCRARAEESARAGFSPQMSVEDVWELAASARADGAAETLPVGQHYNMSPRSFAIYSSLKALVSPGNGN